RIRLWKSWSPPRGMYLDYALIDHRVGDFQEAGDVGAVDVVARSPEPLGSVGARLVDAAHDHAQPLVDLFAQPAVAHAVLRHLEARDRDAAGVRRLARAVQDLRGDELTDAVEVGRHVCALGDDVDAILQEIRGVLAADLVLRRARKRTLRFVVP